MRSVYSRKKKWETSPAAARHGALGRLRGARHADGGRPQPPPFPPPRLSPVLLLLPFPPPKPQTLTPQPHHAASSPCRAGREGAPGRQVPPPRRQDRRHLLLERRHRRRPRAPPRRRPRPQLGEGRDRGGGAKGGGAGPLLRGQEEGDGGVPGNVAAVRGGGSQGSAEAKGFGISTEINPAR